MASSKSRELVCLTTVLFAIKRMKSIQLYNTHLWLNQGPVADLLKWLDSKLPPERVREATPTLG